MRNTQIAMRNAQSANRKSQIAKRKSQSAKRKAQSAKRKAQSDNGTAHRIGVVLVAEERIMGRIVGRVEATHYMDRERSTLSRSSIQNCLLYPQLSQETVHLRCSGHISYGERHMATLVVEESDAAKQRCKLACALFRKDVLLPIYQQTVDPP